MTEAAARDLAIFLRSEISGCIAIATRAATYGVPPLPGRDADHQWIVVANGTVIRSRKEFT